MGAMASQITSLMIVYSTVYQTQIKENIKAARHWPFMWVIHRWPVNSPHKWPVTRKMFPFHDVIMWWIMFIDEHKLNLRLCLWSSNLQSKNVTLCKQFGRRRLIISYIGLCNTHSRTPFWHRSVLLRLTSEVTKLNTINSSSPGQNGHHSTDDIFKRIILNEKVRFLTKIHWRFSLIDDKPALV